MPLAPQHWRRRSSLICTPSSDHRHPTSTCLCSIRGRRLELPKRQESMQSTDLEEMKAALWEQAYHPCTQVSWGMAQVMAVFDHPSAWRSTMARRLWYGSAIWA